MTHTDEQTLMRVASGDGTEIAYWTSGEGPPLVLVHGTASLHTTWDALLPYVEPHATVHAMDRRGRGASGDGPGYELAREYEDIVAVVDAVAEASGAQVDLLGHSFGGLCAMGGATLTSNIRKLILYEGWPAMNEDSLLPSEFIDRLDALLAAGNHETLLETFLREVVRMSDEELSSFRAVPGWWRARVDAAHTIPRELRVETVFDPRQAAKIRAPTMLLVGAESPDSLKAGHQTVAAALPHAQVTVLEGQQHVAHVLVSGEFAEQVLAFVHDQR